MSWFSSPKTYAVYIKPGASHGEDRPVLVKEGFNLFAFLFTFFWALYYRLWLPVLYIVAFNIVIILMTDAKMLSEPSIGVIQLAFQVLVGFHANDWRQAKLRKKGYALADISVADDQQRAEQRYFERMLATAQG